MSERLLAELPGLLTLACAWVEEREAEILRGGVGLTAEQVADAREMGVKFPEKVRLMKVADVPSPEHPALAAAAMATGLVSPLTAGLTLRYGIYIQEACWGDRHLVAHELVHTGQYERMGSVEAFLRAYLTECLTAGYPHGALEVEAIERSKRFG